MEEADFLVSVMRVRVQGSSNLTPKHFLTFYLLFLFCCSYRIRGAEKDNSKGQKTEYCMLLFKAFQFNMLYQQNGPHTLKSLSVSIVQIQILVSESTNGTT